MATPCEDCPRAAASAPLEPSSALVWELWRVANAHGRDGMSGTLQLGPLLDWAEANDASVQDVEAALELEKHLWPRLKPKT